MLAILDPDPSLLPKLHFQIQDLN